MALQNEDAFDILSQVYPDYDFCFIMDQSSGCGKMAEDALISGHMCVYWGGKQNKLHATTVPEVGHYFYNDPTQLHVGDTQSMIFTKDHVGPFYINSTDRKKTDLAERLGIKSPET